MASRRQQNVMVKLEKKVAEGSFYEAHQMYNTLYARNKGQGKIEQARELVISGALLMLKNGQLGSGAELGSLLVESYSETKTKPTDATMEPILKIHAAFSPAGGKEHIAFVRGALKWSAKEGERARGEPTLHSMVAQAYISAEEYQDAAKHLLHAEQPKKLAELLLKWSSKGVKSERDMFIARTVLQLLSLENLRDANLTFECFMELCNGPNATGQALDSPLIHFTRLLLQTCERDAAPLFQLLVKKYEPSLRRDPNFQAYLHMIGQKFFRIQPPQAGGMAGMMANLMNMFAK